MKKEILANCLEDETRVAVIEDGRLVEYMIERPALGMEKLVGNIYKGRIENVLPGISSAFVNVGYEKNAYLYISDVVEQTFGQDDGQQHHTGHSHHRSIDQFLKRSNVLMVQVAKEAIGSKGVKISMDISLPGRFLVYLPFQSTIGVSKNIEEESERRRLKDLLDALKPKRGGFIVRTEAEDVEERELSHRVEFVPATGATITQSYKFEQADATKDERAAGEAKRMLNIAVSYRDGSKTIRRARTYSFKITLNKDQVIRRVPPALGSIMGMMPKGMK